MSRHAVIPPPRSSAHGPLQPEEALIAFGVIFLGFHMVGGALNGWLGPLATPVAHWLVIAVPVIALLKIRGLPLRSALRLRLPRPRVWFGTVALAAAVVAAATLFMQAQDAALGGFEFYTERMARWDTALTSDSAPRLLVLIFTVAITPAICEELLFRGLLTQALAPWMTRLRVCLLIGLLFGLFHADPLQIAPAMLIGAVMTWLVLVSDSLWMPILMHLLFNLTTIFARFFLGTGESAETAPWELGACVAVVLIMLPLALWLLRELSATEGRARHGLQIGAETPCQQREVP